MCEWACLHKIIIDSLIRAIFILNQCCLIVRRDTLFGHVSNFFMGHMYKSLENQSNNETKNSLRFRHNSNYLKQDRG